MSQAQLLTPEINDTHPLNLCVHCVLVKSINNIIPDIVRIQFKKNSTNYESWVFGRVLNSNPSLSFVITAMAKREEKHSHKNI